METFFLFVLLITHYYSKRLGYAKVIRYETIVCTTDDATLLQGRDIGTDIPNS